MSRYGGLIDIGLTDAVSRGLSLGYAQRQLDEQRRRALADEQFQQSEAARQQANQSRAFGMQQQRFDLDQRQYNDGLNQDAADRAGMAGIYQQEVAAPDAAQQILDNGPSGFFDAAEGAQRRVGAFGGMSGEGQRAVMGPMLAERRQMSREARQRAAMLEAEQRKIDNLERYLSTKGGTPKQKAAILGAAQAKLDNTVEDLIKDLDPADADAIRAQLQSGGFSAEQAQQAAPFVTAHQMNIPAAAAQSILMPKGGGWQPGDPITPKQQAAIDQLYGMKSRQFPKGNQEVLRAWAEESVLTGKGEDLPTVAVTGEERAAALGTDREYQALQLDVKDAEDLADAAKTVYSARETDKNKAAWQDAREKVKAARDAVRAYLRGDVSQRPAAPIQTLPAPASTPAQRRGNIPASALQPQGSVRDAGVMRPGQPMPGGNEAAMAAARQAWEELGAGASPEDVRKRVAEILRAQQGNAGSVDDVASLVR